MAKRKRLTPANPGYLDGPALETKSMFARTAPIADVARDASTAAALDEMADTLAQARSRGRMVLSLPLSAIQMDHLVRDRVVMNDEDMATLKESLRARGQQTPIEVTDLGNGQYGLISGWRRCQALAQLAAQEPEEAAFGQVLALLRQPEHASDAYVAMVEENEIRADLSHYERARIVTKATEQGVFETKKAALMALFGTASRSKRSKIGSFVTVVEALDGVLRFPGAIGERLGLQLAKRLGEDAHLAPRLRRTLGQASAADPAAELAVLMAALRPAAKPKPADRIQHIHPDMTLTQRQDGSLLLTGAKVDDALREHLVRWLAARV